MWGVMRQFFACSRGLSVAGGSVESTSSPAPASLPLFRAFASACSSTTGPRLVLIKIAPSFILSKAAAFIIPWVSGVRGQWQVMMSLFASTVSASANRVLCSPSRGFSCGVHTSTCIPNVSAICATLVPDCAKPKDAQGFAV